MEDFKNRKKLKNFGYTFSIIFILLGIYDFFKINNYYLFYFFLSAIFFICALRFFKILYYPNKIWQKFGVFLGIIFSPIILLIVYIVTIIPINLVLRVFKIDIINKNKSEKLESYWVEPSSKIINFKNQF